MSIKKHSYPQSKFLCYSRLYTCNHYPNQHFLLNPTTIVKAHNKKLMEYLFGLYHNYTEVRKSLLVFSKDRYKGKASKNQYNQHQLRVSIISALTPLSSLRS